jgi:hypothetical protein
MEEGRKTLANLELVHTKRLAAAGALRIEMRSSQFASTQQACSMTPWPSPMLALLTLLTLLTLLKLLTLTQHQLARHLLLHQLQVN